MKLLPLNTPQPLVCRDFSETFSTDPAASQVRISAAVGTYGDQKPERKLNGSGATTAEAVLMALRCVHEGLRFRQNALTGYGNLLRVYAEISAGEINGNEKFYAIERTGTAAGKLLFLCGLDVINAGSMSHAPA
jgi:hypothetical protein